MEACVSAIRIVAENISSIVSEQVACWTIEHAAPALLGCACIQVSYSASRVQTFCRRCAWLQNIASRWDIVIAKGGNIAARVPIDIFAPPTTATDVLTLELIEEAFHWQLITMVGVALTLFATTLVEVCVCAISVVAQYIVSVDTMQIAFWACHCAATPLLVTACVPIKPIHACGVSASNICR
jgi:hypothetical protein